MGHPTMNNTRRKIRSIGRAFHNINIAIGLSVLVVIIAVVAFILNGMADTMSKQYAQFYSLETVEKFDLYLDRELDLVAKIAGSKELIQWFADERNIEGKTAAYRKIQDYAEVMYSNEFAFGIEGSLNTYYSVDRETAFEDFEPVGEPLDPNLAADSWYFNCRNQQYNYDLNIDIDKNLHRKRLWINYKVFDSGTMIGEVCSGLTFDRVIDTLFGQFDRENARSLVIDRHGIVQLDSQQVQGGDAFDPLIFEEENKPHIYEAFAGVEIAPIIEPYIQGISGYFDSRTDPQVFKLRNNRYHYIAIAPVLNADWSVVTLYKSNPLMNSTVLAPLLISLLILYGMYVAVNSFFTHRLAIKPLNLLTRSLDKIETDREHIYGLDRHDEFGKLARTIRDIMTRIRNEEERGRIMMETTPIACTLWDEKGGFIDCNAETLAFFGISSKEEYRDRFMELSPEYQSGGLLSRDAIPGKFEEARREGKTRFEWLHQRLDGTPLPTEIVLARVKYGDTYFIAGYDWDLRDSKRMLGEIGYQSNLLRTMNDVAAILFCSELNKFALDLWKCMGMIAESVQIDRLRIWKNHVKDNELYCTEIHEWWRLAEPQLGKDLTVDVSYNRTLPTWEEKLSKGDFIQGLVRNMPQAERNQLDPQGILSILVIPVFLQEQFWGFVGFDDCHREREFTAAEESILRSGGLLIANAIMRNEMTQRIIEAQEAAFAASRAKSDFLSNMSHEIRTPLNAIIGMTSIGGSSPDPERKDYAFGKIADASAHLLGVINDILDMSKIEANKFDLSLCEFNFEKMLQKAANVVNFRVEEKGQTFTVRVDKDIPQTLVGDDHRLAQVITNLLSNAVKFTPERGAIRLNTRFIKEEEGICTIQIEVTDTGIGISTEQQSRLFTSFEQAENSTSRKFGGTGLGLAISRRIVEMMGGAIWIESELGKGATFAFTIAVRRGTEETPRELETGPGRKAADIRILVVDNGREERDYLLEIVRRYGFSCEASGAEDAAVLLEKTGAYDLCFLDWQTLQTDTGLLRRIRETRHVSPGNQDTSLVILISTTEWNAIEEQAKQDELNTFLFKPLFPSAVVDCINKCFGTGRLGEDAAKEEKPKRFEGRRILLAEDVEINREIVQALLEPTGIQIECAKNGIEAVEMFTKDPALYGIIFMDVQMPEMDGYEATKRIRALDLQRAKEIPIIAMTANVFREDIEHCLAVGMNDHVGKPLDFDEVLSKLNTWLPPEMVTSLH
ncbi:hypothetical protein AGMMS49546_20460 [Spirochaetia bacterium]|nr:hypothetical protein AGMMS49546_20460 [Spirochaetia bacterium]